MIWVARYAKTLDEVQGVWGQESELSKASEGTFNVGISTEVLVEALLADAVEVRAHEANVSQASEWELRVVRARLRSRDEGGHFLPC